MPRLSYTLLLSIFFPVIAIWIGIKCIRVPAFRKNVMQRFAWVKPIKGRNIWVHCASVGEIKAATQLIVGIIKDHPKHNIVITTTTPTGKDAANDLFGDSVIHSYFPLDLPIITNRFIAKINPEMVIILEREIWPNLLNSLKNKQVPVLLINARLSKGSFKKYLKISPRLINEALNNFRYIATQDIDSLNRYVRLGANPKFINNIGNIKFDIHQNPNKIDTNLSQIIGDRQVVVFASTHKGEDELIIEKLSSLIKFKPVVIIVPRHPERFDEVYNLAKRNGLSIIRKTSGMFVGNNQILLGDTMDEMLNYLSVSDIVFMGGSLNDTGGHNMLEPALLSKPIMFGPNVENFKDISEDLLNNNAAVKVCDVEELFQSIGKLLDNPELCASMGKNANEYLISNRGSIKKAQKIINEHGWT